jgi:phosphoribosylanthranilate isomerase
MTPRVRVKICGLTRVEDVKTAVECGADAVGFVFWPRSPRAVRVEQARQLARSVPPFVTRAGVFVDMPPADVAAIAVDVGLDVIQLHGAERAADYAGAARRIVKAISLTNDAEIADVAAWPDDVVPIVDSHDENLRGGTGRVANWARAAALARRRPIILAGGLTAANVGGAIHDVRPWAVDVSSGVEERPGVKSRAKLVAFFDAVRAANLTSEADLKTREEHS